MKILVSAGLHNRTNCPVFVPAAKPAYDHFALRTPGGDRIPAQYTDRDGVGGILFILPWLRAGESLSLRVVKATGRTPACSCRLSEDRVSIRLDGRERTGYYFGRDLAKPYLGPFFDRYGSQITRLDLKTQEHPHHRCFWFSHGSVNGVDTWNEPEDHGYIRNERIEQVEAGDVFTGFVARNIWTDHSGNPLCRDRTTVRFYRMADGNTVADVSLTLYAEFGDVTLGQTKEAGPVAVRMNHNLTVKPGTGRFENGCGGINEDEIWMKRAPWCDYYGTEKGHLCGFAILDNPENEGHPCYWHARDYGLMAPNNFYIPGDRRIPKGESMTFRYRLIAHSGTTEEAGIAARFADYAAPPAASCEE
ncbi:MAG: PmoA family protein [Clostridia bacterium]|nr:PmoA family protein [Clostridia bacterium]